MWQQPERFRNVSPRFHQQESNCGPGRMRELEKGYRKAMRRKLSVSETFCRFPAQISGGKLLLPPKFPEGNSHERRFTSCVFAGWFKRE